MIYSRRTLRRAVEFAGCGLHSGHEVRAVFHPSQEGIAFRCGSERVPARPEFVSDTHRCTRLNGISTIEHAMAALAGLEITDAEIELTAPELPALDGSALPYVRALHAAGLESLGQVELAGPFARVFVQSDGRKLAVSAGAGHWRYEFRSAHWPFEQAYETEDLPTGFEAEIAPARTFGFEHEVEAIKAAGLARGLDLESALVLGAQGYVNAARFPDEPARHKLLDAMGDLYLAGIPLRMLNLVAEASGHQMNVQAAAQLRAALVPTA